MLLQISGVGFSLRPLSGLTLRAPAEEYEPFHGASAGTPEELLEVSIEIGNFPDTSGMTNVLGGDGNWSMFTDTGRYVLEWRTPGMPDASRAVCFSRASNTVTVHCSGASVLRGPGGDSLANPFSYPIDQIILMYLLSLRQGAIVHAAGMMLRDRVYVFPGRSGAGKSTLSRLLRGSRTITMLSDDRIILRKIRGQHEGFGTPWPGDEGIAENRGGRLGGIFFLRHASENRISALSAREALEKLIPVTSIPWHDSETLSNILAFCGELVQDIPAYEFSFVPDRSAAELLEDFLLRPVR
ncbi:MAG: hypothetical protein OHK006_19910 [Thermodesulfovibrionales bacterium]